MALDSRIANKGGFLLLDLTENTFRFHVLNFEEDFRRLGFRAFCLKDEIVYAINSA